MSTPKREDILRKVQALLAKAMSTPFEAEADTFRQKANEMMDKYRLEQWELAQVAAGKNQSSLKPVRVNVAIEWWWNETSVFRQSLWDLFTECALHCAIVVSGKAYSDSKVMPVYGLEADAAFLQMLFTDIYIQMADKIKPKYDPDRSLGENVYRAKEAGMTYGQIAKWAGHPEWITIKGYSKRYGDPQYAYNGIMIRSMKKYAAEHGLEVHKVINLDAYVEDFCTSYAWAVKKKLKEMRTGEDEDSNSMALAIIDITDLARELMWEDFPEMRPHPEDCDCDKCHACYKSDCNRPRCKAFRAVGKRRGVGRVRYRSTVPAAMARGAQAGESARIMGRDQSMGKTKEIK